jgi:endonuclease/exonuclease/phosphatase family metal-dependent hydrolase
MSFNVRYGTAQDGLDHWLLRKGHVVATVNLEDPDLLGLQEALPFQASFLAEAMPEHESYGPGRSGPEGEDEACTLLWRRDRFEALARGVFWLSPTPDQVASSGWDAALPRICTWARLRDRHTAHIFVFANTHFDHRGREARLESAGLLAEWFEDERVLLVGDFNAGESSKPMELLRSAGFVDPFRVIHPEESDVGTFTGFRDTPGAAKIDHVLVRGTAEVLAAAINRSRFDGRWPSDHLPVTASLRWRPASGRGDGDRPVQ